jgi:1,4-dihydroxy-2-naphthoate polyprenyltransferase
VLNINNLRDIELDRKSNKRTLVVMIGKCMGRYYHLLLLLIAFCSLSLFAYNKLQTIWSGLFILTLPLFIKHIYMVFQFNTHKEGVPLLLQMVKLALLTNLLYCFGIILS